MPKSQTNHCILCYDDWKSWRQDTQNQTIKAIKLPWQLTTCILAELNSTLPWLPFLYSLCGPWEESANCSDKCIAIHRDEAGRELGETTTQRYAGTYRSGMIKIKLCHFFHQWVGPILNASMTRRRKRRRQEWNTEEWREQNRKRMEAVEEEEENMKEDEEEQQNSDIRQQRKGNGERERGRGSGNYVT